MRQSGVALHAITSEPGGVEALKTRLASRQTTDLPFPVHSDPDNKLCAKPGDEYYIKEEFDAGVQLKGDYLGIAYSMVQPALEVVDRTGVVIRKWSWHSIRPIPDPMDTATKVTVEGQQLLLVQTRPQSADILPSIKEGRDVRLAPSCSKGALVCAIIGEKVKGNCTIM